MNIRVAIITGASRGIGKSIAEKLLSQGYYITVVSENEEELKNSFDKQPKDRVLILTGDLANLEFTRSIIDNTYKKWGKIHVLINNAAWRAIETLRDMSYENWERTLQICLTAPTFLSKWASHYMEKDAIAGVIINISSVMANRTSGSAAAYVACKGALLSLTNEMATLLGPSGIRVIAVSPGNIESKISQDYLSRSGENISDKLAKHIDELTPLRRCGQADEIAKAVVWLCSSDASYITGTNLIIDGGFSANFNGYNMKKLQFPQQF